MPGLKDLINTVRKNSGKSILPLLDALYLSRNGEKEPDGFVHPSSAGKSEEICAREVFFGRFTPPEKFPKGMLVESHSPRTHRIFDNGDFVHLRFQTACIEAGIMDPRKGVGWEIPVESQELGIVGHADGIVYPESRNLGEVKVSKLPSGHGNSALPLLSENGLSFRFSKKWKLTGNPALLEIKSIGERYYVLLSSPLPAHQMQAMCYMALLKLQECFVVYENKNTQEVKEFCLKFNAVAWEKFRKTLLLVSDCHKKKKLPARTVCSSALSARALECPWSKMCFQTSSFTELITVKPVAAKTDAKKKH